MNTFTLLPDMGAFLDAVYDDVRRARERVLVECYIYRDDKLGREFADLLADAAARGVRTRLLYDPFGSIEADPKFFDELRARGVEVRRYRDNTMLFGAVSFATRNHARNIVVDGAAYAGGQAWANEWLPKERGGKGWYDVCVRATGPVVEDFARASEQRWRDRKGETLRDFDSGDRHADVRLISDAPARESLVFCHHIDRIRRAKRRVWMANAYFFPPTRMLDALAEAVRRGVDVRAIVPGCSDLPIVACAARAEYLDWMAAGLKLYEYRPSLMHAKYGVVDDDWCTVGSFNANATSLLWAVELNLFIHQPGFVDVVARHFEADLARSELVREEAVRERAFLRREGDHFYRMAMGVANQLLGPRRYPRPTAGGQPEPTRTRLKTG